MHPIVVPLVQHTHTIAAIYGEWNQWEAQVKQWIKYMHKKIILVNKIK